MSLTFLRVGARLTRAHWCKISLNEKRKEGLQLPTCLDQSDSTGWRSEITATTTVNNKHMLSAAIFPPLHQVVHRPATPPPASPLCLHQPSKWLSHHTLDLASSIITTSEWSPVTSQSCLGHLCSHGFLLFRGN